MENLICIKKKLNTTLILLYLISIIGSIITKKNLTFFFAILVLVLILGIFFLKNEQYLIIAMLVTSLLSTFLVQNLSVNKMFKYIPDFFSILILIRLGINVAIKKTKIRFKDIGFILVLFILNLISYLINIYSIWTFLWGIRVNFRFFSIYLGIIYFNINKKYINKMLKFLIILTILQIPVTVFQYVTKFRVTGNWDCMSGTFGNLGTGIMMQFEIVTIAIALSYYKYKKISFIQLVCFMIISFIPIILGEVKAGFFYIPFLVMLFILDISRKNKLKGIVISFSIILIILVGYQAINKVYGKVDNEIQSNKILSYSFYYDYLYKTSYGTENALNRFNAISYISRNFLNDYYKSMFGIGAGKASYSSIDLVVDDFYKENNYLKYQCFFIPYYILENGWLSLIVYLMFLIHIITICKKGEKYSKESNNKIIFNFVKLSIIILVLTFIYTNGNTLDQFGYLLWFICGLGIRNYRLEFS